MSTRLLTFRDAIREAQEQLLEDNQVLLIGEGVGDPKNIFGTTSGLKDKFPSRVFDSPISENSVTGVCIGASLNGFKPILVHQRIDFSLYSADQLINNAAKWYSMFGGKRNCPLVVRLIVGRGWGQGNQHSQNLTSLYAHVPGLKIVCPSNAYDAKGLLIAAVEDPNPVLFIEHRWLYDMTSDVPHYKYKTPFNTASMKPGTDLTIVASGYAYIEALEARNQLAEAGVYAELVDLKTIKPLGLEPVHLSAEKTGKLLVVDDCWRTCGLGGEIIASVVERNPGVICQRLTYPDHPSASSPALTARYYNTADDIYEFAAVLTKAPIRKRDLVVREDHDVPNKDFRGPF